MAGVRARRAADGLLIDGDDLVEVLEPLDGVVFADFVFALVEVVGQGRVEDLVEQERLAGPGDAGDAGQGAEGDLDVDVLEVVGARAADGELLAVALCGASRHRDDFLPDR